jgi:hypothetical protein
MHAFTKQGNGTPPPLYSWLLVSSRARLGPALGLGLRAKVVNLNGRARLAFIASLRRQAMTALDTH